MSSLVTDEPVPCTDNPNWAKNKAAHKVLTGMSSHHDALHGALAWAPQDGSGGPQPGHGSEGRLSLTYDVETSDAPAAFFLLKELELTLEQELRLGPWGVDALTLTLPRPAAGVRRGQEVALAEGAMALRVAVSLSFAGRRLAAIRGPSFEFWGPEPPQLLFAPDGGRVAGFRVPWATARTAVFESRGPQ